ncbi:pyruvate dehydrogenase E2 component (dihydrolipoamide acetyltransferase) [Halogranum gelatinilyticum]|uniref:Pyruvate dehydrogenase E2 component (Dihydrolipoamide acetyltransferase) n=1 Tax=Halogranum gelatinilyticum TaxID=660521 RepID=A0A1G9NPJ6_9EURY|nr:2-oxo acid dehydrogenase subunit E2 [Halogranum gelatinilyticum]SDL88284.1 pyruvate dehydrogenase E2 component (dihydrolipoamide acetyltransferase) [Halogranum gelatinilyticum]
MGTKDFKLPDVGEGVAEGELVSWLVGPGDTVEEDQPVAEVETDKALVEVPSPYNGTVKELHVEEGTMVPVGDVIITYEVAGEGDEPADPAAETEPEETSEAEPAESETEPAEAATEDAEPAESSAKGGRVFAAPSARRLARELGVDIATVEGSGPSGRVTDADVRQAAEAGEAGGETAEADEDDGPRDVDIDDGESSVTKREEAANGETPSDAPDAAGRNRTLAAPATRRLANEQGVDLNDVPATEQRDGEAFVSAAAVTEYAEAQRAAQEADAQAVSEAGASETETDAEPSAAAPAGGEGGLSGERIPYRGVRRTIGEAMQNSKFTAPHVTHHDSTDVSALVELRAELKEVAAERDVKLSYMPFVMKAIAAALKQYPYMNATLDEENEEIVLRDEYHIGVAVATDAGLMVPVVEDVDKKGLLEIAEDMNDKIERARDRSISRDELRGSTFTITNFGVVGGEYATPIINYPEVGIMGLGELTERPVVEDGEVVARHTLPLSLSIDHRILDGAVAAQFANKVMEYLQHPKLLLLE